MERHQWLVSGENTKRSSKWQSNLVGNDEPRQQWWNCPPESSSSNSDTAALFDWLWWFIEEVLK